MYNKEANIHPAFPNLTVPLGNQIDDENFLFTEAFHLINEVITEFKYHHFVRPNKLIILGIKYQWLLKSQKETTRHYTPCDREYTTSTPRKHSCPKNKNKI